jgi:hypothetical protein
MFYVRLVIATIGFVSLVSANDAWPQFRGPTGNGLTIATHPVEWSEQKNVAWKIKVEGFGWSQPIIVGKRIFVTTVTSNDQPKPLEGDLDPGFTFFSRKGFSRAMKGGEPADIECTWKLLCLKLESGECLWEKTIHTGKPPLAIHRSNSYASETPVSDGQRIYVHVSMLGLWCFDLDGNEVWQKELPNHVMQYGWGPGASSDGWQLYSASTDNSARVWQIADLTAQRQRCETYSDHHAPIYDVGFSHSGHTAFSSDWDGNVHVWDADTGSLKYRVAVDGASQVSVDVSHDGRRVLSTCKNGNVYVWHPNVEDPVLSLRIDQTGWGWNGQFSRDGTIISGIHHVRLWRAPNSQILSKLSVERLRALCHFSS